MSAPRLPRTVVLLCLAEVLSMAGFAAYPAFLPALRLEWGMSGAQAGLVGGAFFFGYMLAVPLLSGMTDRVDARLVFAGSCVLAAAGLIGFALGARGVVTASLLQAVCGAGLAGTYMPGLKALTDRVGGPRQARYIAFYTATFGIGTSGSLLAAGWLGARLAWPEVFVLLALAPLAAAALVWRGLAPRAAHGGGARAPWWPRFGAVLAQATVRRYVTGYAVHCWELFGLRSWMVAFLAFALTAGAAPAGLLPTEAAAAMNLLGLPASILGNEAAGRLGRGRWIAGVMVASGLLCVFAGLAAAWPWWVMLLTLALYNVAVMADSAALTAGLVAATPPVRLGAAMALYSLAGFGAGFLAPVAFGAALDAAGGREVTAAWAAAFAVLGAGCLVNGLWLRARGTRDRDAG